MLISNRKFEKIDSRSYAKKLSAKGVLIRLGNMITLPFEKLRVGTPET